MPSIIWEDYPKIAQADLINGCIPVNIENALKYSGENNYSELKLLVFASSRNIPLGFKEFAPILATVIKNFEFIFKGKENFNESIKEVIEYIKEKIEDKTPVLVSFKQIVREPLFKDNNPKNYPNPIAYTEVEAAHIRTAVGYNESILCFFDPGDCEIKKYNYVTDEFAKIIKGDYHTLVIKKRLTEKN